MYLSVIYISFLLWSQFHWYSLRSPGLAFLLIRCFRQAPGVGGGDAFRSKLLRGVSALSAVGEQNFLRVLALGLDPLAISGFTPRNVW